LDHRGRRLSLAPPLTSSSRANARCSCAIASPTHHQHHHQITNNITRDVAAVKQQRQQLPQLFSRVKARSAPTNGAPRPPETRSQTSDAQAVGIPSQGSVVPVQATAQSPTTAAKEMPVTPSRPPRTPWEDVSPDFPSPSTLGTRATVGDPNRASRFLLDPISGDDVSVQGAAATSARCQPEAQGLKPAARKSHIEAASTSAPSLSEAQGLKPAARETPTWPCFVPSSTPTTCIAPPSTAAWLNTLSKEQSALLLDKGMLLAAP
jgi:hypothetical protein